MRFLCSLLLLCSCVTSETLPAFTAATVGAPSSGAPAELSVPEGPGPFPAVVVLHGCDGVGPHYRNWARQLRDWGYVAMLVDSFRPRGVYNVCDQVMEVPPLWQAQDAFAAADYLRGLPNVRADRIGVIGFSHGASAVMRTVLAGAVPQGHATPFAAAVAFYPGCGRPASPLATDTLILIGDADDWTPAPQCVTWRDQVQRAGHSVQLKIYPGALHNFDGGPALPQVYVGHRVGRDAAAASDAIATTQAFFAQHLAP